MSKTENPPEFSSGFKMPQKNYTPIEVEPFEPPKKIALKREVRNWLNYHEHDIVHEVNTLPSLTIPDQALTVQQILDRYVQGIPLGNMTTPVYNLDEKGEELFPVDWQRLDKVERIQRLHEAREYTISLRKKALDEIEEQKQRRTNSAEQAEGTVSPTAQSGDSTTNVPVGEKKH